MRNFHLLILILVLTFFTGCSSSDKKNTNKIEIDALQREVSVPLHPTRVMGLSPSVTEMLAFVAPVENIIGKTVLCDFPISIESKPSVVVYPDVEIEKIIHLKPDIVFTVEGMTPLSTASKLESLGIPVYYFTFHQLNDVYKNLAKLADLLGVDAESKINTLKERLNISNTTPSDVKVMGLISVMPLYVYGKHSMFSDQIEIAGAKNVIQTHPDENYPMISVEEFLQLNPDILITSGEVEETYQTLLATYPQLSHVSCLKNKRIISIDGSILSRPGPRSIDCVLELHQKLKND